MACKNSRNDFNYFIIIILTILIIPCVTWADNNVDWPMYNGNYAGQHYSPLTQINTKNINHLIQAWVIHTHDISAGENGILPTSFESNPIFVNNTLYVSSAFYNVLAIDPSNGKIKWRFDPHANLNMGAQKDLKTRGVSFWQDSHNTNRFCGKRIFLGTNEGKLYAIDADSGKLCTGFGKLGFINLNSMNNYGAQTPISIYQPPTIYKNLIITGWSGKDWESAADPNGIVRAFDAITGKQVWEFNPIPEQLRYQTGTANVWTHISVDTRKDILYLPTSGPSPNFSGMNRDNPMPYVNAIVALNALTGKVVWSYQLIHHDLWDYDTNAEPVLGTVNINHQEIPIVIQTNKTGFIFVLNRYTGQPIFKINEKKVLPSTIPGENASPTQPYPELPKPLTPTKLTHVWGLGNLLSFGWCEKTFNQYDHRGIFTPPSTHGIIEFPGLLGGSEWGGGAFDPMNHVFVTTASQLAYIVKLIPRDEYQQITKNYQPKNFNDPHYYPMKGSPYGVMVQLFVSPSGIPCTPPPWGQLTAIDLNTGENLWQKTLGSVNILDGIFHSLKKWGSPTIGGPVITKGNLVITTGSLDDKMHIFELSTGKEIYHATLPAPGFSTPSVFSYNGVEYIIAIAGGDKSANTKLGDAIVAFKLKDQ